jgi:hypothetical protein
LREEEREETHEEEGIGRHLGVDARKISIDVAFYLFL